MNASSEQPIDIVITWVDSNDPQQKKKLAHYRNEEFKESDIPDDLAGDTRFKSVGEIYFCLGSILKFASFVHKIFIVTDAQDPHIQEFINKNFPDNRIPIELVDHTVIFQGYEQYLPVFNSLAIETLLYRIPGLSERFVYFNDDVCLLRPVRPQTWFDETGRTVAYGAFMNYRLVSCLRWLKPKKKGHKPFGYKDSMINGLPLIGVRGKFFAIGHTPQALTKSFFEEFYHRHPEYILKNIRHRFREASQFNPQCLYYNALLKKDKCKAFNYKKYTLCIKPSGHSQKHLQDKLSLFEGNSSVQFFCVNSLDQAPAERQKYLLDWLCTRTGLSL